MTRAEPFGEYVRTHYGLDLKRGEHVMCGDQKKRGVVVMCTHHVHVRLDGEKHANPWHPSDIHKYEDVDTAPGAERDAVTNANGSGKIGP